MKLIIDISEETYNDIQSRDWKNGKLVFSEEWIAIHNGTPFDGVLQEIRQEIENNMESIIGKYDANTSEHNRPSHKIERNNGRKECLAIIDKRIKELEG